MTLLSVVIPSILLPLSILRSTAAAFAILPRFIRSNPHGNTHCKSNFHSASKLSLHRVVVTRRMATTTSSCTGTLPLSRNVQQTLDPCVVLMKEMISEYSPLWEGRGGVVSLAQGVVYWDPPSTAQDALLTAMADRNAALHTYCPDDGLPELRDALQHKLATENNLHHHLPLITTGANQAYMNVVLTLLSSDTRAIVFKPYYFNHVMAIQLVAGNQGVVVGPCSDDGVPDVDWLASQLDQDSSIVMVTITNPGNPTGVSLSRDQVKEYVRITKERNVWLVLDCTYEHFDYRHGSETFDCIDDAHHVIHIFSLSKGYALAGFRCGYVVLHESHANGTYQQMRKVQDTIPICPPRISQWAALGAMQASRQWVLDQIQTLDPSRDLILDALSSLNQTMGGSGAMYVMGKLPSGVDDIDLCRALVKEHGVAIIPGSFCGFPGWIRVCYSNLPPGDRVEGAAARLKEGLRELTKGCAAPSSADETPS